MITDDDPPWCRLIITSQTVIMRPPRFTDGIRLCYNVKFSRFKQPSDSSFSVSKLLIHEHVHNVRSCLDVILDSHVTFHTIRHRALWGNTGHSRGVKQCSSFPSFVVCLFDCCWTSISLFWGPWRPHLFMIHFLKQCCEAQTLGWSLIFT